ncbi:hypothetical protein F5141DRAFT_1214441 [Pisolithus sp. B1]|nr:hypothetical protein F5141DRAFT_1214441 [Pisolithus sp. B1]
MAAATAASRTSQGQRRLSARRGSVSAPDPLGKHANVNDDPSRSTCSKLTIVRVVDPAPTLSGASEPLSSPGLHHRRPSRRHGSSSSQSGNDSRLSFAISSFAPSSPTTQAHPPSPSFTSQNHPTRTGSSPSSSPRLRPSSPSGFTRRHSTSSSPAYSRPNLSPEQLVELARQSHNPRFVPQLSNPATSPTLLTPSAASPTFTPLPPDIYLPFIDRPSEVTALLSTPPTAKLFSLLAQTFPQRGSEGHDEDVFTVNPSSWSFESLRLWLATVDRVAANDSLWVRNARKCILAHSELIWERLKGALGVPPELELEEDEHNQLCEDTTSDAFLSRSEIESAKDEIDVPGPSASPRTCFQSENVIIEPIIATPSSNSFTLSTPSNPPPLSLGASLAQSTSATQGDGLQDIGEEGEEEDNDGTPQDGSKTVEPEAQIHGLSISTDPVPSSPTRVSFGLSLPSSPTIGSPVADGNIMEAELPTLPLRCRSRTDSRGSVSNYMRPTSRSSARRDVAYHSSTSDFGDCDSERAYDPVGDRVPGNPLFPSNFARLALGPTLRANNPSLRSSHPATTCPRFARWAPGGRPPSWIDGWDSVKHEYAATVASGSSIGVGDGE